MATANEKQNIVFRLGNVRAGCALASWAVETIADGNNLPENERERFALYEGVSYILTMLVQELDAVHDSLNDA